MIEQTLSADEDCELQFRAPEKASQWTLEFGLFIAIFPSAGILK